MQLEEAGGKSLLIWGPGWSLVMEGSLGSYWMTKTGLWLFVVFSVFLRASSLETDLALSIAVFTKLAL